MFWRYLGVLLLGGCAAARSAPPRGLLEAPQRSEPNVVNEWEREPGSATDATTAETHAENAQVFPAFLRQYLPSRAPSLLGAVVAHPAGQDTVTAGIGFGRVHVTAKIAGGFAYTEVEEELVNDSSIELEAVAAFRAPSGGVIARMALWVENRWIEAEVVESQQARSVYEGIVQRQRDPALLVRDPSGVIKLRVFPVPAHGARRVVVGYVQPLERQGARYRFELGLQLPEGAPPLLELSAELELTGIAPEQLTFPEQPLVEVKPSVHGTRVRWGGVGTTALDWRVSIAAPQAPLTSFVPVKARGAERFVALRVTPELPSQAPTRDASVWLIDTSAGQRGAALDASKAIVAKLLKTLPFGANFGVLACDTACIAFPARGLTSVTADARKEAQRFVAGLEATGASDIGYALFEALQRTQAHARAQLVYFGDAQPTAGDLHAPEMRERLLARRELLDLRLVGIGAGLDAGSLSELAAHLTAARTTVGNNSPLDAEAERIGRWLAEPLLRTPSLSLPKAFESAYPQQLPNLVRGDEELILARLGRHLSGLPAQLSGVFDDGQNPALRRAQLSLESPRRELRSDSAPRLWAHARLRDLDADDSASAYDESVELSKRYQVLSRHTALLALESDAMFRAFGIGQRFGRADFGSAPVVPPARPKAAPQPSRAHRVRPPTIRMSATKVSRRLPPEPIRDIVRRNDGRFRACYHQGLLKNPKLEGTVTTRFLIGRDGTVASSVDSGSTLADRAVVACIVRTFQTLVFPAPDAVVTVVYPFVLSPSTAKEERWLPTPWTSSNEPPLAVIRPASVQPEPRPSAPVMAVELAAQVELQPLNVELQLATARAYEAERSERRACAHFRAAAGLAADDVEAQYQALRCRARVMNERVAVLADVQRLDLHSPSIDELTARIRALADIPPFSPARPMGD